MSMVEALKDKLPEDLRPAVTVDSHRVMVRQKGPVEPVWCFSPAPGQAIPRYMLCETTLTVRDWCGVKLSPQYDNIEIHHGGVKSSPMHVGEKPYLVVRHFMAVQATQGDWPSRVKLSCTCALLRAREGMSGDFEKFVEVIEVIDVRIKSNLFCADEFGQSLMESVRSIVMYQHALDNHYRRFKGGMSFPCTNMLWKSQRRIADFAEALYLASVDRSVPINSEDDVVLIKSLLEEVDCSMSKVVIGSTSVFMQAGGITPAYWRHELIKCRDVLYNLAVKKAHEALDDLVYTLGFVDEQPIFGQVWLDALIEEAKRRHRPDMQMRLLDNRRQLLILKSVPGCWSPYTAEDKY